jgi:hypothetical protein
MCQQLCRLSGTSWGSATAADDCEARMLQQVWCRRHLTIFLMNRGPALWSMPEAQGPVSLSCCSRHMLGGLGRGASTLMHSWSLLARASWLQWLWEVLEALGLPLTSTRRISTPASWCCRPYKASRGMRPGWYPRPSRSSNTVTRDWPPSVNHLQHHLQMLCYHQRYAEASTPSGLTTDARHNPG